MNSFSYYFGGKRAVENYIAKVKSYSPIAYWPMNEITGSDAFDHPGNGRNGAYTGVTLNQVGIGDDEPCPLFDGTNDYNEVYSISLRDAFDGAEGTLHCWAKVSAAGVWTGGSWRAIIWFQADVDNYVLVDKTNTTNQLRFAYNAAATYDAVLDTSLNGSINWFSAGITWSASSDEVKAYINGSQAGSTRTGLGTWAGNIASATTCVGATSTAPSGVWDGYLAHGFLLDYAATAAQMADLAVVP
jgi:hypothetical protein